MAARRPSPLHRVLGHVENLDTVNLTNLVQRLARERALLEAVFDTIREGILVVDAAGVIQYANAAARAMTGLKDEDLARLSLWKLVPGLAASLGGGGGLAAATTDAAVAREVELSYPEARLVRLYMVPFSDGGEGEAADGEAVGGTDGAPEVFPGTGAGGGGGAARAAGRHAVILTDITRERQTTEERIESERLSSIFLLAGGVAHEIGNPLNSLHIHLQLLERKLARGRATAARDELRDAVGICRAEVQRLDGIIRNFLEAIRPRAPDLREVRLLEVIEEVLRVLGPEMRDRGVAPDVEAPADLPSIRGDRAQLHQAIFNVVKNGMEAMEGAGGRLSIKARADDDHVRLFVADTGAGIRAEELGRVFEPFHTTKKAGHGLGLVIVERILRAHGGRVGIDSKEGVGTVVTLQIPRRTRTVRLLGE